jgi:hypothetical protein
MRTRKSESRLRIVVEGRSVPLRRRMTGSAVLRKSGGRVGRIAGRLVVFQMARYAVGVEPRKNVTRMTLRARGRSVLPCQREACGAVVEGRALPLRGGVARRTGLRERRSNVIGRRRRLKILEVAGDALGGKPSELSCRVALPARDTRVSSRQRKFAQVVIELRVLPGRCGMAGLALHREVRLPVIRICRPFVVGRMAAATRRRRPRKSSSDVTARTGG